MAARRHDETERKYDVGTDTILPPVADVDGVAALGEPVEMKLEATYFDTPDLDLAQRGITLRRRTGGQDAGWHLKLPSGIDDDTRTEMRLPLGRATKTVPVELLGPVRALVRNRPVAPVARLSTRRLEYDVIGKDAVVLAQICDDEVQSERLHGPSQSEDWREWEVELVDGSGPLLDAIEQRLLDVGASPAATPSKLRRTLGDAVPQARKKMSRKTLSRGSAAQLLLAHLAEHTQELHTQDARLRADLPGSVHKLRIAARRLRSALKTYRPLLASESVDTVGEELRWLGQVLSGARDAQVLRERLHELVISQPAELVQGRASQHIDDDLRDAYHDGRKQALQALDTDRYFRLLDALDELVHSPCLTSEANGPVKDVLPRLLARDTRRLRRAVQEITPTDDLQAHDQALHEARKKAKRLRYAAESAVPVFPDRAKHLATTAKQIQEALGEHQDAVVARDKLHEYGAQTQDSGDNGFTLGRLHALEQTRADAAEHKFWAAWRQLPQKKLRKWVRS